MIDANELTRDEFFQRLIAAGWDVWEAEEEANEVYYGGEADESGYDGP